MNTHQLLWKNGKIACGSVLHDKLFVDILQYGVTSCTHMGLWQTLNSYCSVAFIFIIFAIHYFCLAYVSVRLSICLGFSPSFPSTSLALSLSLSLWSEASECFNMFWIQTQSSMQQHTGACVCVRACVHSDTFFIVLALCLAEWIPT